MGVIMFEIQGQCTGGLLCNGGCCRCTTYNADGNGSIVEGFCQHYQKETGNCGIYSQRAELGFAGCLTFPTVDSALMNGLPQNCGYRLVEIKAV